MEVKKATGYIYEVKRKWWSFGKYIEIVLRDKKKLISFLVYRFSFDEPLSFGELSEKEKEKKRKKLDRKYSIDWYKYFSGLKQQEVNIDFSYKEYEVGEKIIVEVVSVKSNSGPIAVKFM